ncbi:hypothetical protein GCM10009715_08310 [Paeniglutamicibacter psychrophenolicus]
MRVDPRKLGWRATGHRAYAQGIGAKGKGTAMYTLQIEHGVKDFEMWKGAYGADPLGRIRSGVLAERIFRPVDDRHYVVLDLDFASRAQAQEFLDRLRSDVWSTPVASPALASGPKTRIVEQVDGNDRS